MTERTPTDYALEFAEYMAKGAEQLIEAVNALAMAEQARDEGDGDELDAKVDEARQDCTEFLTGLRNDIHQFRTRRDRAARAAQSSTVGERERFEAWYSQRYKYAFPNGSDTWAHAAMCDAWEVWQAAQPDAQADQGAARLRLGTPPSHWDEWAMRRARAFLKRLNEAHHPPAMLTAAAHSMLIEAMAWAAEQPAAQAEPVAWRYRHILNTFNTTAPEAITEWKPVEPRDYGQTLEQRIAELRAYRYEGRPCYEVQALYAAPPSNPPAQRVALDVDGNKPAAA